MSQKVKSRPPAVESKTQVSCDASTEEKSATFLKQMIALPISHIVFLRGIFGPRQFSDRYIGDLQIKMLKKSKADDNAHLLCTWMKGCFNALELKYLKSVTLTIHDIDDPRENPIESYTFAVTYKNDELGSLSMQRNGENISSETFSEKNLKAASIDCLNKLLVAVESLDVLPDEVVLNMELSYYDDRTPKDYEPEGFRPAPSKPNPADGEVGRVETKFHSLRVKVFTREFADLSRSSPAPHKRGSETSVISLPSTTAASVGVVSPTVRAGSAANTPSSMASTAKYLTASEESSATLATLVTSATLATSSEATVANGGRGAEGGRGRGRGRSGNVVANAKDINSLGGGGDAATSQPSRRSALASAAKSAAYFQDDAVAEEEEEMGDGGGDEIQSGRDEGKGKGRSKKTKRKSGGESPSEETEKNSESVKSVKRRKK